MLLTYRGVPPTIPSMRPHDSRPTPFIAGKVRPQWKSKPVLPVNVNGVVIYKQCLISLGYVDEVGTDLGQVMEIQNRKLRALGAQPTNADDPCFGAIIQSYLERYVPTLAPVSKRGYISRIQKYIAPQWAAYRSSQIRKMDVQEWIGGLDLAGRSKRVLMACASSIWECGLDWELLEGRNPFRGIKRLNPTRLGRVELRALTFDEVGRLLECCADPIKLMAEIALYCGLRIGEILALQKGDCIPPYLHVRRAYSDGVLKAPKNGRVRRAPIDPSLARRIASAPRRGAGMMIFDGITYDGAHWHLDVALGKAGIEFDGLGWHTLRSTYATWKRELGAGTLQESMGHAAASTTDGYVRMPVEREVRIVEVMRERVAKMLVKGTGA